MTRSFISGASVCFFIVSNVSLFVAQVICFVTNYLIIRFFKSVRDIAMYFELE